MDDGQRPAQMRLLHERLLAGDRGGLGTAYELYARVLAARLAARPRLRSVDPHMIEDGVTDAIFEYVTRPQAFHPSRDPSPEQHLFRAAWRNVLNLLRAERRLHGREREAAAREAGRAECFVELRSAAGNSILKAEADQRDRERRRLLALFPDPRDRRVLELQLDGERKTAVFAEVLGIGHLTAAQQRIEVKRTKDRIDKVLRRAVRPEGRAGDGPGRGGGEP